MRLWNAGLVALDFFDQVSGDYGASEEGVSVTDTESVEIPSSTIHLTDEQLHQLEESVDPLSDSDNFGLELYQQALEIITKF